MTVFRDKVFKEVKMRLFWWALTNPDWCLEKKRLQHRETYQGTYAQREDQVRTERELRRNKSCPYIDHGLLASRIVKT